MATICADNRGADRYLSFPGPSGFLALEARLVGGMVGWRHSWLEAQMTERTSDGLDPRRRKLLFRCWHRGMREMDLILGRFADSALE